MTPVLLDLLECPACRRPFSLTASGVACPGCQAVWPCVDGIPVIGPGHDTYVADELTAPMADELIRRTRDRGWISALEQALAGLPEPAARYLEAYVCSAERSFALELMDIPADGVLLDHGCGWGAFSLAAAERTAAVVALDLVIPRVRFTTLRAQQSGADHVAGVVGGGLPRLPFRDASFDAVVMNGVLEWIPTVVPGEPTAVQAERLREVARVLRPGGSLLLGIENRYWWRYFVGHPEVHTGVPYASIVPRALADHLARRRGSSGFRVYTHSLRQYRALLTAAGFADVQAFVAAPDYNRPREFVPVDQPSVLRGWSGSRASGVVERGVRAAIATMGLVAELAYCYCFVCRRA